MPNDSEMKLGRKTLPSSKRRILFAMLFFLMGVPPLINTMNNPRIATLRGPDVLRVFAIGFCWGIGFSTLVSGRFLKDD